MVALRILAARIAASLRRWPTAKEWQYCALLLAMLVPVLAAAGCAGGFAHWRLESDLRNWLVLPVLIFFVPALGEELLFRSWLTPRDRVMPLWQSTLAVFVFVLWHPFQAITFGPPWAELFLNFWFLLAVAALGWVLVAQFRRTGSLWPCVFTHWLVVATWKLAFGGPTV